MSNDNVVEFGKKGNNKKGGGDPPTTPPGPPELTVHEDLVEALEELLEAAKLGHIVELAGCVRWVDDSIGALDCGIPLSALKMYGALSHQALEYRDFYLVDYGDGV